MADTHGSFIVRDSIVRIEDDSLAGAVIIEQRPGTESTDESDGTCKRIWPTCLILARYLCAHPALIRGRTVVELGAGVGGAGLVCAALGARRVVLTDMLDALPLISDNVKRNPVLNDGRLSVEPCTWGDDHDIDRLLEATGGDGFDVVLCCEVIYKQEPEVLEKLAVTQKRLARPESLILVAYEFRGGMLDDLPYFEAIDTLFDCESVSLRPYEGGHAPLDDEEEYRYLYIYTLKNPPAHQSTGSQSCAGSESVRMAVRHGGGGHLAAASEEADALT
mmetsp:Transcript_75550/g.125982  ORF Transcript_75550/g.125982 Transcript_75550/m.125982 type:complete len:277 (-) Transcript_75550:248-1078(-)|eukprot:CAMPEP_0119335822 /NCGR_PEP_ID=MMETSP1333-20130426/90453_1 /TAXON_ID=418940 /ORGANISM="Scyphosphaera apsteinii, Strain RCC1455" /LENGTH=276 /DNA_ID=CAMNT_0007346485 /DNA_START=138 /DNA_END=968 /DNA_ORIENTATION=+